MPVRFRSRTRFEAVLDFNWPTHPQAAVRIMSAMIAPTEWQYVVLPYVIDPFVPTTDNQYTSCPTQGMPKAAALLEYSRLVQSWVRAVGDYKNRDILYMSRQVSPFDTSYLAMVSKALAILPVLAIGVLATGASPANQARADGG